MVEDMDPKVCFTWMMAAAREGEMAEAREHAENLLDWLDRGGFVPMLRISADDQNTFLVADELAVTFCRAACDAVLKPPPPKDSLVNTIDDMRP